MRKRVLGEEHLDTLTSMNNLTWTWKSCGRDMDALKLITGCLGLLKKTLGDSHPNTVACGETVKDMTTCLLLLTDLASILLRYPADK